MERIESPIPTIYLEQFDEWNATEQKCPVCGTGLIDFKLDTIGNVRFLMYYATCPNCEDWVYILPVENERIYVDGPHAVTYEDVLKIHSSVSSGVTFASDLSGRLEKDWTLLGDLFEFFTDWTDEIKAKMEMLYEWEKRQARDLVTFTYEESQAAYVDTCMKYGHEEVMKIVPEEIREELDGKEIVEIGYDPEKRKVTFYVRVFNFKAEGD